MELLGSAWTSKLGSVLQRMSSRVGGYVPTFTGTRLVASGTDLLRLSADGSAVAVADSWHL